MAQNERPNPVIVDKTVRMLEAMYAHIRFNLIVWTVWTVVGIVFAGRVSEFFT